MQDISSTTFGLALMAGIIYVWLRAVARNRNSPPLARAKSHSFWCALIAFFASTSTSGESFWSTTAENSAQFSTPGFWLDVLSPALWLGTVYLIGLYSWPRELKSVRSASLESRSLTTPIPRRLLATVSVLVALSVASLWPMLHQPGFAPVPAVEIVVAGQIMTMEAQSGVLSGERTLLCSALLIVVLIATMAILALVTLRRRPLNGITHHDNQVIRSLWLNRLLRTGGFLLTVIIADNLRFAATSPWAEVADSNLMNLANVVMLAVSAVMFFWAPKSSFEGERQRAARNGFGRARDHLLALAFVATTVALLSVYVFGVSITYVWETEEFWERPVIGEYAFSTLLVMLLASLSYLLTTSALTFYGHFMAGAARDLPRHSRALPRYLYWVAGILAATGIYLLFAPPHDPQTLLLTATPGATAGVITALAAGAIAAIWWVRHCAIPWKLSSEEEIWYRQVLEFRFLRTMCSVLLLMPTWTYDLGPLLTAIGLIPFCIPSMVVLNKPTASIPYRQFA